MYHQKLEFQLPETGPVLLDLAILVSAFIFGHFSTSVVHAVSGTMPAWYQDIQAWFALLALLALGVIVLIRLVINPNIDFEKQINTLGIDMALVGFVGFYFGARS